MKPLALDEVMDLEHYAALRNDYRAAVIAHKRNRRVAVGEKVTLVFEDRETLRFQVQEMLRVERIGDPALVQRELDVYNELMPGDAELSATLFIEITDLADIRPELDRLVGIDEHVALVLGGDGDEQRIPARFDPKQMEEERIAAVQYIRFPLGADGARRFADPDCPARIRIDHPNYEREVELSPEVRRSLASDLRGGPAPLLGSGAAAPASAEETVLFTRGRARALRPSRALAPGHVIVESSVPVSLLEADAALHAELLAVVLELARDVAEHHGRCRIRADSGERLRWHVHAAPR